MQVNPGDRAMIVGRAGLSQHLFVKRVTVSKVYKNGIVVLNETDQKYRADGYPTGERQGYGIPAKLRPWDDAVWQDFQRGEANRAMASKLFELAKRFQMISRDSDRAAQVWDDLPFKIQQILEEANSND